LKTESSRAPRPGTLALLTSGGDCADHLDAVILVVVRRIAGYGWRVIGVRNGTLGLMKRPVDAVVLSLDAADGTLLRRGGTILGSSNTGDSRI
jgi:6-phosphofructokinase 1